MKFTTLCQMVFQSCFTSLHFHEHYLSSFFSIFWTFVIIILLWLTCRCLMSTDIKLLFLCLLASLFHSAELTQFPSSLTPIEDGISQVCYLFIPLLTALLGVSFLDSRKSSSLHSILNYLFLSLFICLEKPHSGYIQLNHLLYSYS